ncbi:MAG: glycosyltransferase [Candidatus Aminicenantes bacterium]|nr:glycosyltransferase [Candidatus Aminicenantes bacterium]
MKVNQWVPSFHRGDAIGDTAQHIKTFLRSQGFESEIYCLNRDQGLEHESGLLEHFPRPEKTDITLFHFALPSPMTDAFRALTGRRVLIYHNITPPQYFENFSEEMARITQIGRKEAASLSKHTHLALADSEYNREELEHFGFQKTDVFPLFVDFEKYNQPVNPFIYDLYNDDRTNLLFVGRIVPNKKIEDLIRVVQYYKKYISPLIRLIIIGKTSSLPQYHQALIKLMNEFFIQPDEVVFTGHIPDSEMMALYKASDVFLSLSEHEGFGLPFIESLVFDLPVIAYNCTAVPYTLEKAGILVNTKDFRKLGELIDQVTRDKELRAKVIRSQRKRLKEFKSLDSEKKLLKTVYELSTQTRVKTK